RVLSGIFDSHITAKLAKEKMTQWMTEVSSSELTCFNRFIKTLTKYKVQVSNYFIGRYNSGFVEGFNNRVKVLKRRCYGLSNVTRLFQRLIIDTMGLEKFARNKAVF
ncbi:MAG: transposase, partial [Alteromonadaceae bacterium]|nr:transposase [Alteromonadaceae bacterium]